mgnify:CR=1 FL=1
MRKLIGISGIIALLIGCLACVSLPLRKYEDKEMKLDSKTTEKVWFWQTKKYVRDVMLHAKGYSEPIEGVTDWIAWMYVGISGVMFLAGFGCFALAMMTHIYKANAVGFLLLIGSGVAAGFAEFANWWWTVPATGIVGVIIWLIAHRTKDFNAITKIKQIWSNKNGNN